MSYEAKMCIRDRVMHVVGDAAVCQVQIVGTGGIFGGKGVYLLSLIHI